MEPQAWPLSITGETGDCNSDPGIDPEVQRDSLGTEGLLPGEIAGSSLGRLICPYLRKLPGWLPIAREPYDGDSILPRIGVVAGRPA